MDGNEELSTCIELQRDIWGRDQPDIVPSSLLHVVGFVGGIVAGAFDTQDTLLGFVFGLTGPHDGELAHWSHMLGVREGARDRGVGRLLKEHQRDVIRQLGVKRIYWSFDPLQSKNAYFNINRLGAAVDSYVPDMYGTTKSPLHLGMATDRVVARMDTDRHDITPARIPSEQGLPILTPFAQPGDTEFTLGKSRPALVLIEIPADIGRVLERSRAEAQVWRLAVRDHFQWVLANGYTVGGVHRAENGRTFYIALR
jgi:chorismate synthase